MASEAQDRSSLDRKFSPGGTSGPTSDPGNNSQGQYKQMEPVTDKVPGVKKGMSELAGARRDFSTNTSSNSGPISDPEGNGKGQYNPREEEIQEGQK